jgi:drug/metabolite transporter (DMT)-like permease
MFSSHQMRSLHQSAGVSVAALFTLSLLESIPVLVRDLLPNLPAATLPPLENSGLAFGLFGLFAVVIAAVRHPRKPFRSWRWLPIAAGLILFAIPITLAAIAARYISPLTVAAIQTLAPLFTIILEPYLALDTASESHTRYGILPALLAFSGVLLIFPVFVPSSYMVALALTAALVAAFSTGAGNCLIARAAVADTSLIATAATASISASVALGLLSAIFEEPRFTASSFAFGNIWPLGIQACVLGLLFWLARRLTATRLATRVLWALILPILLESVFLPVPLDFRNWSGLALMLSGAGAMLFLRTPAQEQNTLSLR